MEHLYLDESGSFEGGQPEADCFVGGLFTSSTPEQVARVLRRLVDTLAARGLLPRASEPHSLHATEVRRALPPDGLALFRTTVIGALDDLDGIRLASCRWYGDAEILVEVASDKRGFNRYLRMWSTLVRHATWFPWWSGGDLHVCTAQRSFPRAEIEAADQELANAYSSQPMGDRPGVRVAGVEQLPQLLRGLVERRSHAPFARRIVAAEVGSALDRVTWAQIEERPMLAGLILADLACDLLRAQGDSSRWEHLEIAYHPAWSELEELAEWSTQAEDALGRLVDLAIGTRSAGPPQVAALAQRYADRLLTASLRSEDGGTRARTVSLARQELDRKEARFPRTDRLFSSGGLPQPPVEAIHLAEWVQRTIHANHSGEAGGTRKDALTRQLANLLDEDVDAVLGQLETIAVLAVGYQDDFDFDQAIEIAEPWQARAAEVVRLFPRGRWTAFGRLTSNLAQSLAYRQQPGDLRRAVELMRLARSHLSSPLDQAQWACHAANLAVLAEDQELLETAWAGLFDSTDPLAGIDHLQRHHLGPTAPLVPLFAGTVVTRTALVGKTPFAATLRSRLSDPAVWHGLVERVRSAADGHPLERYLRHLAELAPREEGALVEQLVARSVQIAGDLDTSATAPMESACTYAAAALSRLRVGDTPRGQALAGQVVPTLLRRFSDNEWAAPTVLCLAEGYEGGWLHDPVLALQKGLSEAALEAFVERFRYEWR